MKIFIRLVKLIGFVFFFILIPAELVFYGIRWVITGIGIEDELLAFRIIKT